MDPEQDQGTREARAAQNQSLFRAVNEKLKGVTENFRSFGGDQLVVCECADVSCVEQLELRPEEYEAVRGHPLHFVVLRDHVYPEVERIVREHDDYVIVEKERLAADVARTEAEKLEGKV